MQRTYISAYHFNAPMPPRLLTLLLLFGRSRAQFSYDDLPQWSHICPLISHVRGGHHVLSEYTPMNVIPASPPMDLFRDDIMCIDNRGRGDPEKDEKSCQAPSSIAYGNILLKPQSCSSEAAASALSAAANMLHLDINDLQLISVKVYQLDVTQDSIHAYEILSSNPFTSFRHRVNVGINFFLRVIDSHGTQHQIVVQLQTREHAYTVLQHTKTATGAGLNDRPTAASTVASTAPPPLRILSYNVWNVNPPREVYGEFRRWDMYNKRIAPLISFINVADADIIGLQEVRVDDTFGPLGDHAQIQVGTTDKYRYLCMWW
jgi:hypothetical protein